jgi:hypothetical protein
MIELYRRAFRYYWSALPMLLGFMALVELLLWYLEPSNPEMTVLVATLIIVYHFHRHFLFGETFFWKKPPADAPPQKFGWFLLLSLALFFVPIGLGLMIALSIAPAGSPKSTQYGLTILTLLPLYLVSLSLFGTALPASVEQPGNFRMVGGMRMCLGTMWRLILGPGVMRVAVYGLAFGLNYVLGYIPAFDSEAGQLVANIVGSALGSLPFVMAVAVLCHMYRKVMAAEAARYEKAASQS